MEYINKENLIKAIEDKRPLNWNDTEAELAEQRVYDDIIELIEGFNEEESDRINELMEANKEGRCIILSEIKDGDSLPGTEVIATNNIKYSYGYGSYLIGYIVKDETSETGYSCENDFSILLNVTHWGKLPKIAKEEEE